MHDIVLYMVLAVMWHVLVSTMTVPYSLTESRSYLVVSWSVLGRVPGYICTFSTCIVDTDLWMPSQMEHGRGKTALATRRWLLETAAAGYDSTSVQQMQRATDKGWR